MNPRPVAIGTKEEGFTQPRYHLIIADPCSAQRCLYNACAVNTGRGYEMCPKLRELAPMAIGTKEVGFTQPRDHL